MARPPRRIQRRSRIIISTAPVVVIPRGVRRTSRRRSCRGSFLTRFGFSRAVFSESIRRRSHGRRAWAIRQRSHGQKDRWFFLNRLTFTNSNQFKKFLEQGYFPERKGTAEAVPGCFTRPRRRNRQSCPTEPRCWCYRGSRTGCRSRLLRPTSRTGSHR